MSYLVTRVFAVGCITHCYLGLIIKCDRLLSTLHWMRSDFIVFYMYSGGVSSVAVISFALAGLIHVVGLGLFVGTTWHGVVSLFWQGVGWPQLG